ncbi:MAG: hypothetical protein ABII74_00835 [Elusimicrobiota bacterium]
MLIFDASTLILLSKIDLLEIFISNFDLRILIPEMIRTEVCIEGRNETPLLVRLIKEEKISVLKVKNNRLIRKFMEDFNIDIGEAEVLALALEEKVSIVATDDRNAIRACKVLKIDFITAIAVLIRTLEKKLIDKEEAIIKLKKLESVARYNRAIIEDARNKIAGGF